MGLSQEKTMEKVMKRKNIFQLVRESTGLTRQEFWEEHMEARGYSKSQVYRLDESCTRTDSEEFMVDLWEVSGWSADTFMETLKRNRKRKN